MGSNKRVETMRYSTQKLLKNDFDLEKVDGGASK